MELTELAKKKVTEKVKFRLCDEFEVSFSTINRWINHDNEKLSTLKGLEILQNVLELEESQIFKQLNK